MGAKPAIGDRGERYALAVRAADEGLWDWDLENNEVYFCPRWKSMLGFAEDEIGSSPDEWFERVSQKDLGRLLGELSDHLYRGAERFASEHRILHRDGTYRWVLSRGIALREESGKATRIVGSQTDITDRKRAEDRLRHDASHDGLTGLPNRAHFGLQLQKASMKTSGGVNGLFAVLVIDLDDFKDVNDGWGHHSGDQLLINVAERLQRCVRPGDLVARLGGDEFGVLLRNLRDPREATQVTKRIQNDLAVPCKLGEQEFSIAASIGIALGSGPYDKAGDLLRNADEAMYRAKARGRAQYELFEPRPAGEDFNFFSSETALRRWLQSADCKLFYQPFIAVRSGEIRGCEVLLRRRGPSGSFLPARNLVEGAGDAGMAILITEWVLTKSSSQMKAWQAAGLGELVLCVPISARELSHPEFLQVVERVLRENRLELSRLQLDVSQSALTQSSEPVLGALRELCARGVRVYLDDFGAAYSSLVFLRRYPISGVKIDESLLRYGDSRSTDDTGASGLIELAHSMGLDVTLTGVDNLERMPVLAGPECEYVQGRIVSQPLAANSCQAFLQRSQGERVTRRSSSHSVA